MEKIFKLVLIIVGALVVGGIIGWGFDQIGVSTPVAVAVILAAFAAYEAHKVEKEN